jgi:hypothetical protein
METTTHVLNRHGLRPIINRRPNSIKFNDDTDPGTTSNRKSGIKIELVIRARSCPTDPAVGLGLFLWLGRSTGRLRLRQNLFERVLLAFLGLPELLWILLVLIRVFLVPVLLVLVAALLVDDTNRRPR